VFIVTEIPDLIRLAPHYIAYLPAHWRVLDQTQSRIRPLV